MSASLLSLRATPALSNTPSFVQRRHPPCHGGLAVRPAAFQASSKSSGELETTSSIYIAALPLVGTEFLEELCKRLGGSLPPSIALHRTVLVRQPNDKGCHSFDFLPAKPTDPGTAAALLSGRTTAGQLRERQLSRVPRRNCNLVGHASPEEALPKARSFQKTWDCQLKLFENDCRDHVRALALHLVEGKLEDTSLV